jgi:hypothetical protein
MSKITTSIVELSQNETLSISGGAFDPQTGFFLISAVIIVGGTIADLINEKNMLSDPIISGAIAALVSYAAKRDPKKALLTGLARTGSKYSYKVYLALTK